MFSIVIGILLIVANILPAMYVGFSGWTAMGLAFAVLLIIIGIFEEKEKE